MNAVHAADEVPLAPLGMHVLQPGAPRGIRADDAKALAVAREPLAEGRHAVESPFKPVLRHHGRDAPACEKPLVGRLRLLRRVEVAVGDDAVAVRAEARKNRRMIHIGFRREAREVIGPVMARADEFGERGHFFARDEVGAKAVEADDEELHSRFMLLIGHFSKAPAKLSGGAPPRFPAQGAPPFLLFCRCVFFVPGDPQRFCGSRRCCTQSPRIDIESVEITITTPGITAIHQAVVR